jgi:hypothetical protein
MLRPAFVALCAAAIATGAMAQSTDVAVCDDFLTKYEICANTKMPAEMRDLHKDVIDHIRKTFGDVAKGPGGKSSAESGCKQLVEGVKALLMSVGCTF